MALPVASLTGITASCERLQRDLRSLAGGRLRGDRTAERNCYGKTRWVKRDVPR